MEKKKCRICREYKELTNFNLRKCSKDGYRKECKDCRKKYLQKYYKQNKDKIAEKNKEYRNNNIESIKKRKHEYYENNREHELNRNKEWRNQNQDKVKNYKKEYYLKNKDEINKKRAEWYDLHREEVKEYNKEYRKNNHKKIIECQRLNIQKRCKTDFLFKMKFNIRILIRASLRNRGFSKKSKTAEILGCSYDEFKNYILENVKLRYPDFQEEDFLEKGKYHIDHIIPLATANSEEEVIKLNHYTNLQLLTAEDNINKGSSLDWESA